MDEITAIGSLGALAQHTRLEAFRLLVRHEPTGLAAGDLAGLLAVPPEHALIASGHSCPCGPGVGHKGAKDDHLPR